MAYSSDNNTGGSKKSSGDTKYVEYLRATKITFNVKVIFADFEFKGFDPVVYFEAFMARAEELKVMGEVNAILFNFNVYFGKRGSNVTEQALNKSSPACANYMREWCQKFGIMSNLKNNRTGFTLTRISATFPHYMLALSNCGQVRKIVAYSGTTMPEIFAYPGSPSIMSKAEWIAFKEDYLDHMVKVHKVINTKNSTENKKPEPQVRQEQDAYAEIMVQSTFNTTHLVARRLAAMGMCKDLAGAGYAPSLDLTKDQFTKQDVK